MAPKTKTTKKSDSVATTEVVEVPKTKGKVSKVQEVQDDSEVSESSDVPVVQEEVVEVDKFSQIIDKLQSFINESKELILLVKVMQKEHQKLQKHSSKKSKKAQANGGEVSKRSPSGFAKPTKLSDDLCKFLNIDAGSSMARTIVTKHINEYIKKNNLQDQSDKRHIIPDANLKSILSISEGDKLTYFNLQTYIKQHFKKE